MKRLFTALVGTALTVMTVAAGAGEAAAAPLQQLNTTSTSINTLGDHSFCRGTITYKVESVTKKRGVVRVTATSHGFVGDGVTWKKNPRCRVLFRSGYNSVKGIYLEKWTTGSFGPRRGEKKTWDVMTGSGPASLALATYSSNSPIRVPTTVSGTTFLVLVP